MNQPQRVHSNEQSEKDINKYDKELRDISRNNSKKKKKQFIKQYKVDINEDQRELKETNWRQEDIYTDISIYINLIYIYM